MVEVTLVCEQCQKEFMRAAATDEEIKELQRTIWQGRTCPACILIIEGYWE